MEVHHHGHVSHDHKWKDYLYQFAMLFLAVFFGFLAEVYLEYRIDKEKEKDFAISIVEDLQDDIRNIDVDIENKESKIKIAKLLKASLINGFNPEKSDSIYYLSRKFSTLGEVFYITDGTLMELKNSGGLRLMRQSNVVDSLQSYYNLYQRSADAQRFSISTLAEYRDYMIKVFDAKVYENMTINFPEITMPNEKPKLFNEDKQLLNEFMMRIQLTKTAEIVNLNFLHKLRYKALKTIELIKQDYNLTDDEL